MIGDYLEHYFTNNPKLKSEMRMIQLEIQGVVFTFFSDLGVFSKDKIDYGSKLLIEAIYQKEKRKPETILDVGCGYGVLGIVLGKHFSSEVDFIDVNDRALHLCSKNIKENNIKGHTMHSNCYECVDKKYHLIVTNPPIRAGKNVVLEILLGAQNHLEKDGTLWFVMRKDQGAKSIKKELEKTYQCEIVTKSKGFYVIKAKRN